ncbi:MAG: hypothetical protein ACOYL3_01485 [Desulfuromonadaceae bacterium]
MKRSWLLHLFITLSVGLLATGQAGAVTTGQITTCVGCHGTDPSTNQVPVEGTVRNSPARAVIGSHSYHVTTQALTCSDCHVVPITMNHRDGNINMAPSMHNGVTYSAASGGIVAQDNQLSTTGLGTCSGGTNGCHTTAASPVWGTASNCQTCHGYPPVTTASDVDNKHVSGASPVNHIGTGATVNTKATFVSVHGGCQICHGTESSTGLGTDTVQAPHANYDVATQHATGNINMNGPVGVGTGYDATIRGCTAACHASTAPYRMTASAKTLTFGNYGTGGDCISCHTVAQPSPVAQGLSSTVTSRVAIVPDFSLASKHTRSRGTAVTKEDCCVCHMEGDVSSGSPNGTYHKNGYIELRDPDLGTTIKGVTHSGSTTAAGVYTVTATDARPVRFSRNLGNATIEPDTAAIMVNLCLKCHDADGALSTTARVAGGSALKPFAGTVAANPGGGVLNVAGQFASTNKSHHPILTRSNNGYTNTGGTRMVAPWNAVAKTATTTTYGPLITCWDCHAPNGSTAATILTSSGIHGGAVNGTDVVELRGNVYVNGTTTATNLCIACHVVTGNTSNHGTGSAITSSTNSGMTYFANRCFFCHGSYGTRAAVTRPMGSGDAHGFNTRATGAAFPAVNNGYAFLRNEGWYANAYTQSIRSIGTTTYTPTCGGMGAGGGCSRSSMGGYTPGGVY